MKFKDLLCGEFAASERMREAQTVSMVQAVLPFCFRPAPSALPLDAEPLCGGFVSKQYSFVEVWEEDE